LKYHFSQKDSYR